MPIRPALLNLQFKINPMNILLLGYGKMGQLIDKFATRQGHSIAAKIHINNREELDNLDTTSVEVSIDFSQPEAAVGNIKWCIDRGIPAVVGTTGWLSQKSAVDEYCQAHNGTYLYASNFSIGVNIFFKLNEVLARYMNGKTDYKAGIKEIHHTQKLDAPSGTAITLAEGIIDNQDELSGWKNEATEEAGILPVISERVDPAPGTHIIRYDSAIDRIDIRHTAHSREGFAKGALMVAEWIAGRKGILTMDDFLRPLF